MNLARLRRLLSGHLLWMAALACVLLLAQGVSSWHQISHAVAEVEQREHGRDGLHVEHCELCLLVAAIGCGAPPVAGVALGLATANRERPLEATACVHRGLPTPAYRSRAPPAVSA